MKKLFLVLSGLLLAGCSSDCGKPVYRSPCVPELQSAAPAEHECGPVYTAPHCLPSEEVYSVINGVHQKIFGCPAPK